MQNRAHLFAGGLVQSVAHQLHAENEHGKPAENIHQHGDEIDPEFAYHDPAGHAASGDFDIDVVFSGCFSHENGCRGASGCIGDHGSLGKGCVGSSGRRIRNAEKDRNARAGTSVCVNDFHRERFGGLRTGANLLVPSGDSDSGDETDQKFFIRRIGRNDLQILIPDLFSRFDGDPDESARIGDGFRGGDFEIGTGSRFKPDFCSACRRRFF